MRRRAIVRGGWPRPDGLGQWPGPTRQTWGCPPTHSLCHIAIRRNGPCVLNPARTGRGGVATAATSLRGGWRKRKRHAYHVGARKMRITSSPPAGIRETGTGPGDGMPPVAAPRGSFVTTPVTGQPESSPAAPLREVRGVVERLVYQNP